MEYVIEYRLAGRDAEFGVFRTVTEAQEYWDDYARRHPEDAAAGGRVLARGSRTVVQELTAPQA